MPSGQSILPSIIDYTFFCSELTASWSNYDAAYILKFKLLKTYFYYMYMYIYERMLEKKS